MEKRTLKNGSGVDVKLVERVVPNALSLTAFGPEIGL